MNRSSALAVSSIFVVLAGCQPASSAEDGATTATTAPRVVAATDVDAGRYLVMTGGCNDCHTPGFAEGGGKTPEAQWLMGAPVGFKGPWGVTYPHNLRITVANMSEDAWVAMLNTRQGAPPMPWPSVRAMSDSDKRAVYRYIRSLGPGGAAAPTALPPGVIPTTPYQDFSLVTPPAPVAG